MRPSRASTSCPLRAFAGTVSSSQEAVQHPTRRRAVLQRFRSRIALIEGVVRDQVRIAAKPLAVGFPSFVRCIARHRFPVVKLLRPHEYGGIGRYLRDVAGRTHSPRQSRCDQAGGSRRACAGGQRDCAAERLDVGFARRAHAHAKLRAQIDNARTGVFTVNPRHGLGTLAVNFPEASEITPAFSTVNFAGPWITAARPLAEVN